MAYSDFTLKRACRDFSLTLVEDVDLHADLAETETGELLRSFLDEYASMGIAINTEKARSEFIVAPILADIRRRSGHRVSLFSGIDFEVDLEKGLNGICDFLISRSTVQLFLEAPVLAVVEAKKDDIKAGLGQCAAEMVAARLFNEREGRGTVIIHGVVTTGSLWRFLRLAGIEITVDKVEYPLEQIGKVLAILMYCAGESA